MSRHLVLVGAGHVHLSTLSRSSDFIEKGHRVTVINPLSYLYYSGMGPGMLSGVYQPQEIRFNVKRLTEERGGTFVEDSVVSIDPVNRSLLLGSGGTVNYDVVSFGIGSGIDTGPMDASYENVFKVKPVEKLFEARCRIIEAFKGGKERVCIIIIGGGASGVEMAANAWRIVRDMKGNADISLITAGKILSRFPLRVRKKALKQLAAFGIKLEEDTGVKGNTGTSVQLEGGRDMPFDFAFLTTGVKPPDVFVKSGIPAGEDGGLLVNRYLQSVRHPEIFGGGDCISFDPEPLEKVGVFAVRENPILLANLGAALEDAPLTPFNHKIKYLLILNMGDGTGIFHRRWLAFGGTVAFKLKNYIDKKFMDKFQLSGELEDRVVCE
ncbi:MAG: FAD-dependent oxidoreductase [bacterium]|nr:FAD-dependent oxidoreductase [bacterium]